MSVSALDVLGEALHELGIEPVREELLKIIADRQIDADARACAQTATLMGPDQRRIFGTTQVKVKLGAACRAAQFSSTRTRKKTLTRSRTRPRRGNVGFCPMAVSRRSLLIGMAN